MRQVGPESHYLFASSSQGNQSSNENNRRSCSVVLRNAGNNSSNVITIKSYVAKRAIKFLVYRSVSQSIDTFIQLFLQGVIACSISAHKRHLLTRLATSSDVNHVAILRKFFS